MIPGEYNITIYRGSTWTITIAKKNASDVYIDFEAAYINQPAPDAGKIEMHIRPAWKGKPRTPKLTTPLFSLTIANSRISASTTTLTLTIAASDTKDLDFNTGTYDIELVTGDAVPVVDKVLFGKVTVKDEKTV